MHIMMMGPVSCGKTSLCQYLAGLPQSYAKTQTVGIIGSAIDTPGEYLENRPHWNRLLVTAADAGLVLFLQDCTNRNFRFSPGLAAMFGCPVAGVATKIDLAEPEDIDLARELLALSGADPCFAISIQTGAGIDALTNYIKKVETGQK